MRPLYGCPTCEGPVSDEEMWMWGECEECQNTYLDSLQSDYVNDDFVSYDPYMAGEVI
jgi:hypothetical protein